MTDEYIIGISSELKDCEALIRKASAEYRQLARDAANARFDYDLAWASAILEIKDTCDTESIKMTVGEKEALAVKQVANFMQKCRTTEAVADASKRHLESVLGVLSSIQTRSKLILAEASLK